MSQLACPGPLIAMVRVRLPSANGAASVNADLLIQPSIFEPTAPSTSGETPVAFGRCRAVPRALLPLLFMYTCNGKPVRKVLTVLTDQPPRAISAAFGMLARNILPLPIGSS